MAIEDLTEDFFEETVLESEKPFVVYFSAKWCGPCHAMKPIVEELSEEMSEHVLFGKADVDYLPSIAAGYGIRSIPTFMLFRGGEPVLQASGSSTKDRLKELIEKHL
jgi:thioredoxin 1